MVYAGRRIPANYRKVRKGVEVGLGVCGITFNWEVAPQKTVPKNH